MTKATTPKAKKNELPPAPVDKARNLQITREPGKSDDRLMTDIAVQGLAGNAWNAVTFNRFTLGELSLTDMVSSMRESGAAINGGDLAAAERMLFAQAVSLNAISAELARRAFLNMGEHLPAMESYMRLSLKAQAQCRVTVEALAEIKNPRPVAFVKQANISNGPQQVNNGVQAGAVTANETSTRTGAHAGETQMAQSKLLEASDVERLDTGTQSAAGAAHQDVETVGVFNRPDDRGR
jgi:hypothetical protein